MSIVYILSNKMVLFQIFKVDVKIVEPISVLEPTVSSSPSVREQVGQLVEPALRIAYRQLGNWEDARDVVQDVVLKILQQEPQLATVKDLRAWMFRMVLNRCTDWWRMWHRFRRWQSKQAGLQPELTDFSGDDWFQEVLQRLSRKQRIIVVLIYEENFSIKEVGEMLHLSPDTVRVHLMRARKKIRKLLEQQGRMK